MATKPHRIHRLFYMWCRASGVAVCIVMVLMSGFVSADEIKPFVEPMSRGEYLAHAGDCSSCHVPGPQQQAYVGGLAIHSPLGTIYATNITPDPDTGIGKYSLEDFTHALRDGIAKDGHHLYPAMPYTSFTKMSDADIRDLYDYFMKEVAPVHFQSPETKLSFPFNQRWGMAVWNFFFAESGRYQPRKDRDAQWNRGAYLVQSAAHCGACHTPRGFAYQERGYSESSALFLTGALEDNWFAVNLAEDQASGLGAWSEADVAAFLKTGYAHHAAAFGNMQMVIENSLQFISDADRAAIAHYVKSLPAPGENASYKPAQDSLSGANATEHPGAGIYMAYCSQCHGATGIGHSPRAPGLAGNPAVLARDPTSLIRLLVEGQKAPQTEGMNVSATMPGFGHRLTDQQIGDVLSYIRTSWGNAARPVTTRDVSELRKQLGE